MSHTIEMCKTNTDRKIVKEANSYGLEVMTNSYGYTQFRDAGQAKAWMSPTINRQWVGHDGTNSFTGLKSKVADWCIDRAVNGPL